jgi:hypothetical protein
MGCTANDDDINNTLKYCSYETLCRGTVHDKCMMGYNGRHKDHNASYVSVE